MSAPDAFFLTLWLAPAVIVLVFWLDELHKRRTRK